jgi:hypothetical protein
MNGPNLKGPQRMRKLLLAALIPLGLGGCLSFNESTPPKNTTVVVPPGSSVACANGQMPPC